MPLRGGKCFRGFFNLNEMTKETLAYIDSRIKAITELEIQALADDNKKESTKLNAVKIELIDLKIFVCDQAMKEIKSQLNVLS